MKSFRANASSLVTAIAVLLVSATCSSAGCLLRSKIGTVPSESTVGTCCAAHQEHAGDGKPAHPDDRRCPLCQHTVQLAKTIDQGHVNFSLKIWPSAFCLLLTPPAASTQPSFKPVPARGGLPPGEASTLLDLHCALLI